MVEGCHRALTGGGVDCGVATPTIIRSMIASLIDLSLASVDA